MPYIHCPQCRLTIYGGTAYNDHKRCPRCDVEMTAAPRPLFRSFGLRTRANPSAKVVGRPVTGGEQLNTG